MKYFLILFLILSQGFSSIYEKERIVWSQSYKLSWSDFKGIPNKGSGFVASTNSGISFSYSYGFKHGEVVLEYEVKSNFYPMLSWYIPSEVTSKTLNHEQTHFDISELHARLLRKKISETKFSKNIEMEIETLYNNIENERKNMQYKFDKETDHSNIKLKEHEWEDYVREKLENLHQWE